MAPFFLRRVARLKCALVVLEEPLCRQ